MRRLCLIAIVMLAFTGCDKDIREVKGPVPAVASPSFISR